MISPLHISNNNHGKFDQIIALLIGCICFRLIQWFLKNVQHSIDNSFIFFSLFIIFLAPLPSQFCTFNSITYESNSTRYVSSISHFLKSTHLFFSLRFCFVSLLSMYVFRFWTVQLYRIIVCFCLDVIKCIITQAELNFFHFESGQFHTYYG